jgi:hypothetical protein
MSHGEDDRFPSRTLVMDVTMTHDRYGRTTHHTNGTLSHRVSSTGVPQSHGALNKTVRMKIRYYRQIYEDRPDPIVFLPIAVITSGRVYEDFARLLFLTHIVTIVFWPENYLRNRNNFVSSELHA